MINIREKKKNVSASLRVAFRVETEVQKWPSSEEEMWKAETKESELGWPCVAIEFTTKRSSKLKIRYCLRLP